MRRDRQLYFRAPSLPVGAFDVCHNEIQCEVASNSSRTRHQNPGNWSTFFQCQQT